LPPFLHRLLAFLGAAAGQAPPAAQRRFLKQDEGAFAQVEPTASNWHLVLQQEVPLNCE